MPVKGRIALADSFGFNDRMLTRAAALRIMSTRVAPVNKLETTAMVNI